MSRAKVVYRLAPPAFKPAKARPVVTVAANRRPKQISPTPSGEPSSSSEAETRTKKANHIAVMMINDPEHHGQVPTIRADDIADRKEEEPET